MTGYIAGTAYTYERSIDISFMQNTTQVEGRLHSTGSQYLRALHRYEYFLHGSNTIGQGVQPDQWQALDLSLT